MAQWDDIQYFFDEGIAYMVELIKSKNDIAGTYVAGVDAPRFGWGIDGTRLGTISESAVALYDWLDGMGADPEVQNALFPVFAGMVNWTLANRTYARLHQLARQLDGIVGANAYIIANDERLSEHVQDILGYLLPQNVFMEQTTIDALGSMGGYLIGGAYNDGAEIDEAQFGNHNLIMEVTNGAGCRAATTIRAHLHKWGDPVTIYTHDVVWAGGEGQGTRIDIGVHDTDMYTDLFNMTLQAGGFANDIFQVYAEEERDVVASWWT